MGVSRSPRVRDLAAGPQPDSEASRQHSTQHETTLTHPLNF
jgi:hypothetical protein